ncbi:MAG: 50S ribosomal protein L13 [Clostridia bacterium]|nr:50S ribosomal protein L13 [Clostridia bacterium]
MGTYSAKAADVDPAKKKWYVIDAQGKTLGRLATVVARLLTGKNKPEYTPNQDTGDFVIVLNADKVVVTGKKETDKLYRHHTGYAGGLKEVNYKEMIRRHPTYPVEAAVRGMLPKNALGRQMFRKLKVYTGAEHDHQAQKPETYEF